MSRLIDEVEAESDTLSTGDLADGALLVCSQLRTQLCVERGDLAEAERMQREWMAGADKHGLAISIHAQRPMDSEAEQLLRHTRPAQWNVFCLPDGRRTVFDPGTVVG